MKDNLTLFVHLKDGTNIMFKGETQVVLGNESDGSLLQWLVDHDKKKILVYGDKDLSVSLHHID